MACRSANLVRRTCVYEGDQCIGDRCGPMRCQRLFWCTEIDAVTRGAIRGARRLSAFGMRRLVMGAATLSLRLGLSLRDDMRSLARPSAEPLAEAETDPDTCREKQSRKQGDQNDFPQGEHGRLYENQRK